MVVKKVAGQGCQSTTGWALVDARFGWCVLSRVNNQDVDDCNKRDYEEIVLQCMVNHLQNTQA